MTRSSRVEDVEGKERNKIYLHYCFSLLSLFIYMYITDWCRNIFKTKTCLTNRRPRWGEKWKRKNQVGLLLLTYTYWEIFYIEWLRQKYIRNENMASWSPVEDEKEKKRNKIYLDYCFHFYLYLYIYVHNRLMQKYIQNENLSH